MKIQIILIAMILAITSAAKVTRAEETNCPECKAKQEMANDIAELKAQVAELKKMLEPQLSNKKVHFF